MAPDRWSAGLVATIRARASSPLAPLLGGAGQPRASRVLDDGRFVDVHGGRPRGRRLGGGSATGAPDFFRQVRGPAVGAEVGIRLLILDLSFRFLQTFDADGRGGTISYIPMLGPSVEIPVARHLVLRPSVAAGFGFGTPGPAHAPLTADQISAKGLLVMGRLGVERFFGPVMGLAAHVEGG